jgi:hypothetical protein
VRTEFFLFDSEFDSERVFEVVGTFSITVDQYESPMYLILRFWYPILNFPGVFFLYFCFFLMIGQAFI